MMKNKTGFFRWGIVIGLLVLLVVCLLAGGLYYFSQRARSFNSRPLVLIHNPINRDHVVVGDGIIVHATARSQAGLARMELWADDVLVAEQEAPEGMEPVSLVLSAGWVPMDPGDHRLVVRAISVNDVEGQSTIALTALDTEEEDFAAIHIVEQGETLETIAAESGTTAEELADLNPGLDAGGPSAGDELIVPNDEPASAGSLPETEDEAPPAAGQPFGEMGLFLGPVMSGDEESDEPIGLQMELTSLRTGDRYESLHCYVGLAGTPPRWYPDRDGDQTTDESFSASTSAFANRDYSQIFDDGSPSRTVLGASSNWNIDEYLSGQAVPVLFWPGNLSMPFEISCVGISGGGTEALELGSLALSIEPDEWDGIVRRVYVTGPEGSFTLGYRVGPVETQAGAAKEIDSDMTAPTNLRAANYHAIFGPSTDVNIIVSENDPFALLWNYNPGSDELPIEGFRIYLNGNLQWTERTDRQIGDNHYTVFPAEWQHPPCGEQYTLTVSAWRPGGIDGHESYPAEPAIVFETPADECQRYINITLLTLETFDIGGDGWRDHRVGDVGPPFGHFYANEEVVTFDTGHPRDQIHPPGLNNNDILNLHDLSLLNWGFSGRLRWRAALDEYNQAILGFEIWDEDTGRCDDADDPGCPDLLCEGQDYFGDNFGIPYESELYSSNRACKITFSVEMAPGSSPSTDSFGNIYPTDPLLGIGNLIADERNRSTFQVTNHGNAWTYRTLEIEVMDRSGNILDTLIIEDLYLDRGDSHEVIYDSPDLNAVDVCFRLDIESQEGISGTSPQCPGLPILSIDEIHVDVGGDTHVAVSNIGTRDLRHQNISLELQTRAGESLGVFTWEDVSLAMGETLTLEDPGRMVVPAPYDACAVIVSGILENNYHISPPNIVCTQRPDLAITNVEFVTAGGALGTMGTMNVTVWNYADNLTDRTITLTVILADSGGNEVVVIAESFDNLDLGTNRSVRLSIPVPNPDFRRDGYTVEVNRSHAVVETTYLNNSYSVPPARTLKLYWCNRYVPHMGANNAYSRENHGVSMDFSAAVVSGTASHPVTEHSWSGQTSYLSHYNPHEITGVYRESEPFQILGDESLIVEISAAYRQGSYGDFEPIGTGRHIFSPNEHWGAGRIQAGDSWGACRDSGGGHTFEVMIDFNDGHPYFWYSSFLVCEVVP